MREIDLTIVEKRIKEELIKANYHLNADMKLALQQAYEQESNERAKDILQVLIKNYTIADEGVFPICQDTGVSVVFCEIGEELVFTNGSFKSTINKAVAEAYKEASLRKSIVQDPLFKRENTKDNTPAICHFDIVPGDQLTIYVLPKGGGSENMSVLTMLKPSDGIEGLKKLVINQVIKAGGNPCPPLVIGIGVGGNFETCALLAKKSLLREIDEVNPDQRLAELEAEILQLVNETGIGPMGLGGKITALKVNILCSPCHIASLPVAINLECHAHRFKKIVI